MCPPLIIAAVPAVLGLIQGEAQKKAGIQAQNTQVLSAMAQGIAQEGQASGGLVNPTTQTPPNTRG